MRFFWNTAERRLRAGWRILLQAALMVAMGLLPILLIAEPLTALHRRGLFLAGWDRVQYDRAINMIVGPFLMLAIVGSVILARRFLDRGTLAGLGVTFDRAWWRWLAGGFGLGAALMAIVFAAEHLAGWIRITHVALPSVAYSAVKVSCVGIYEELVFRGYLLRNLTDGLGRAPAVAISCLAFGLIHATNENASLMSTLGLVVNGALFVAAAVLTGRLSAAIGLHVAWNFFEGAVFGFPVSGDKEPASIIGIVQSGPELITGGAFGPEAGLIGIAASVIGMLLLMRATPSPRH